jgi:hypothetical protein
VRLGKQKPLHSSLNNFALPNQTCYSIINIQIRV